MNASTARTTLCTLLRAATLQRSIPNRNASKVVGTKLVFAEFGDPIKVLKKEKDVLCDPGDSDVIVKMIAAPVNPADINTIEGKYPSKPNLPGIPGNEGVGEIVHLGCDVRGVEVGDRVIPFTNLLGTWRTHAVLKGTDVLRVPKDLGIVEACTLAVNPCTAYRMLKDFVKLKAGDVVIQNGANSACGQNVIQLARIWGLKTVNIIRDRKDISELKDFLLKLGATEVLTEEELRKTDLFRSKQLPRPKLALNCVGGKNAVEVLRQLEHGGFMVTYGGMSKEPVIVPTSALIFKDVNVRGFWMTHWSKVHYDAPARYEMFNELIKLMVSGELQGPVHKMVPFDNFQEAVTNASTSQGMIGLKYLLQFS